MPVNQFYRLGIASEPVDQWVLNVDATDPGMFERGGHVNLSGEGPTIGILQQGRPLAFNLAHPFTPVVTPEIGSAVESLAPGDVQRIPARVKGSENPYEILNILTVEKEHCIDAIRTPKTMTGSWDGSLLTVAADRVHHNIFRIIGTVIVSGDIKAILKAMGVEGIRFTLAS